MQSECFVIAPIGEADSEERKRSDAVFEFIIKPAAEDIGLTAIRADHISKPRTITLQVIQHVVEASAVVADLSTQNPNVFYELGIRHAFRRPVVLIAEMGTRLPFDVGHERTIFFDHRDLASAGHCRKQISEQLREASDPRSVDSPVSNAVDISMLKSGNPVEQQIANLVDGYESLMTTQSAVLETLRMLMSRELLRPMRYEFAADIPALANAIQGNVARLEREIEGASGVDTAMLEAILRDTRAASHHLVRELREAERESQAAALVEQALEDSAGDKQEGN